MAVTIYLKRGRQVDLPRGTTVEPACFPHDEARETEVPTIAVKDRDGKILGHFATADLAGYQVDDISLLSASELQAIALDLSDIRGG